MNVLCVLVLNMLEHTDFLSFVADLLVLVFSVGNFLTVTVI